MPTFYGLKLIDVSMIVLYFAIVMAIGFWASRKVKTEEDFFLGGRSFGKGLLVMHWLCTGTHSDHAVQVAGATARVGLGGIWFQWMWLFATPFYWLIAPITRRLRVTTTADVFRLRYDRSLEMMYSVVGLSFYVMSMAMLLRGAGAAIAGATGGAVPTNQSVIVLAILFSTYTMAGGLVAAAYTDYLQGLMIIVLSVMLVPAGLNAIGGIEALHRQLDPGMMSIVAPAGAKEGDPWFIFAMSILSLVGIVAQPHVMSATGSGKSEIEARVGMCYGNFIKRFLTIAWAFTGVIAVLLFPDLMAGLSGEHQKEVSETLFGRSIQLLLGDGWRGLMIACLIAGVTSAETFMVVGSAIFVGNFYRHVVKDQSDRHYLWAGRASSAALLAAGILTALTAGSVTQILQLALDIVGLMGPAFWLGVLWRRANTPGVWASVAGGVFIWLATKAQPLGLPGFDHMLGGFHTLVDPLHLKDFSMPIQVLITLGVEFGLLIAVSLVTPPQPKEQLDPFYSRLLVPVGKEAECSRKVAPDEKLPEWSTLGIEGTPLDYGLASQYGNGFLRRFDIETPRMNRMDAYGFLGAWALVGTLILLLMFLSGLGR